VHNPIRIRAFLVHCENIAVRTGQYKYQQSRQVKSLTVHRSQRASTRRRPSILHAVGIQDNGIAWSQNAFTIRPPQGVLDTLSSEGYRSFAGAICFYEAYSPRLEYEKYLSRSSQDVLKQWDESFNEALDNLGQVLRAVLAQDKSSFEKALASHHPTEIGRFVALIHICKEVQQMHTQGNGYLVKRFTTHEIKILWERFTPLWIRPFRPTKHRTFPPSKSAASAISPQRNGAHLRH